MGCAINALEPRTGRRRASMLDKWKFVLAAALIPAGASVAPAKDGAPPTIDVARNCRAAEAELKSLFSNDNSDVYGSCVADEEAARVQVLVDSKVDAIQRMISVQPDQFTAPAG